MINPGKLIGKMLIRGYQIFISPIKGGPSCRYFPSCSSYAYHALSVHGFFKGTLLAIWRLMRCNPWTKGGVDQVPAKGRWKPEPFEAPSQDDLEAMWKRMDKGEAAENPVSPISPK